MRELRWDVIEYAGENGLSLNEAVIDLAEAGIAELETMLAAAAE